MKLLPSLLFFVLPVSFLSAQVSFSQFPKDNELYPRDLATNNAVVQISGTIAPASADSLVFSMERSDGPVVRTTVALNNLQNGYFEQLFSIKAMLQNYHFSVALKNADSTWQVASSTNVVAGDVFMVQGQSNAQAIYNSSDANIWQSNYVRCFGTSNPNDFTDQQWYIAEGNGYFTGGSVGQWALRMGTLLQESQGIPIAIINGADPGKPIEFFQRNDALPNDPATNYGRLLQRLTNAKLTNHLRAILYYQGESDGDRAEIHKSLFEALYAAWATDFQSVESYYVVQVREGCGAPSLQLREYQKDFESYLPKLKSITANGIPGHDGCHYELVGYEQLGIKLYKQLSGDLYNAPFGEQLNVRVLDAQYSNETNTQITLTTDAIVLVAQNGSESDFKIPGISSTITSISIDANKIILTLDQPVYDEHAGISYSGHAGDANGWVLNGDGYGLFSFYNLPITNHTDLPNFDIPSIMSGPGNCLVLDGSDDLIYIGPVLNKSYTKEAWINWQGGGLGNNIISGVANTAFWLPSNGNYFALSAGHNGAWGQVTDPAPMIPNQWTHVAVTYDDKLAEMRLYKNGNLISLAHDVPAHNDPELFVGAYSWGYTFQGRIDEVRIWDTVRSLLEIRDFMCQKLQGDETGLSSYFRFDQTSGDIANNVTDKQAGQLFNFQNVGWQRSGASLGTKSTNTYQNINHQSLALASGDSLVLSNLSVPESVHLYFTEELPNVLEPATDYVLVDNHRYFGLFYPNNSIDAYTLRYYYKGNPLSNVDEPRLSLLQRAGNAQPFWEKVDSMKLDIDQNFIETTGQNYQEYILAIQENTLGTTLSKHEKGLLYPNPSKGFCFIKDIEVDRVVVYDALRRHCFEQKGPLSVLNMQELSPGLYFVEVWDNFSRVYQQKLVLTDN